MGSPLPQTRFSPEDYLAWEATQETKNEYLDGEVSGMVGVKDSHAIVAGNLFVALKQHLKATSCRTYAAEMKLRVESANAYFYPDVFVTCDERDRGAAADYFKSHAVLVIEVLSDSTAAYDRGRKFACYRQLPSLREFVIVDPDMPSIECFRRDATDHWVLYPFGAGERVDFASVGLSAPMEEIYEGVDPDAAPTEREQAT